MSEWLLSGNEFSLKLRLPCLSKGGWESLELRGPWARSLRGLSEALASISSPMALEQASKHAGMATRDWRPGMSLSSATWMLAGWPNDGFLSAGAWDESSARSMEALWASKRSGEWREPWSAGGWGWSHEKSCWEAQVYILGGRSEAGQSVVGQVRRQPAALTLWQQDKDPWNEDHPQELGDGQVRAMCSNMGALALGEFVKGAKNFGSYISGGMAEIALLEKRLAAFEEADAIGSMCMQGEASENGSSRL